MSESEYSALQDRATRGDADGVDGSRDAADVLTELECEAIGGADGGTHRDR
jgi:hypothetical protein